MIELGQENTSAKWIKNNQSESEVAQLCLTLCNPMDCSLSGSSVHGFSRQECWSGLPFPSPGIFPTQESNPGLPHCGQTLYHLNHRLKCILLVFFHLLQKTKVRNQVLGFSGGSVVKNSPASVGDTGSIPDPGRSHILQST